MQSQKIAREVSIVIPAYNEEKTIKKVLERLLSLRIGNFKKQIIVINDGSIDNTEKVLKPFFNKITYHKHSRNFGKGQAVRSALKYARGEITIIQDADMEYLPKDIPVLVNNYQNNKVAAVYGSRRLGAKRQGYLIYVLGDKLANIFFKLYYQKQLTDIFTGYKLIKTSLLKKMELKSKGFEVEMEITNWLFENDYKIIEVPISYFPRTFKEGKKLSVFKAFMLFCSVFKFR